MDITEFKLQRQNTQFRLPCSQSYYIINFNPFPPSISSLCIESWMLLLSPFPAFTLSLNILPNFTTASILFILFTHNSNLSLFFLEQASAPVKNLHKPPPVSSPRSILRTFIHFSSISFLSSSS